MKKFNFLFLLLTLSLCSTLSAQTGPFLEATYDVEVQPNVIYGVNATILPIIAQVSPEALPRPLNCDVYSPVGDDNDARPLVLVLHTGNFLPFPANNGTGGTITDSTVVETCTRLAARGYVAVAMDYRIGWNPIDPSPDIRKFFLINAAYRGIQDLRTAVRFFRKDAVEGGNNFGIDPNKIGSWGIGTGGYIVAGAATIDDYTELVIPKFLISLGGATIPMVIEPINGNIYGTSVGIVSPDYAAATGFQAGDTLCYPNHVAYADGTEISSDVQFTVNLGGALGDLSWLDENVAPWVSFQVPLDEAAPYTSGTLTVPGTGDPADPSDDFPVVDVDGAYNIQQQMNALGFNDIFDGVSSVIVDYSEVADARNDGFNGLFPMPNNAANGSSPWDFYAEDNANVPPNPLPEIELAKTYWDTIFAYVAPRACLVFDLECEGVTRVTELVNNQVQLQVMPNPATSQFTITTREESPMMAIEVYDLNGRLVQDLTQVNANSYTVERNNLPDGVYFVRVHLEEGVGVQKIMFN